MITWPSPSTRVNCWPASTPCCAGLLSDAWESRFGPATPTRFDEAAPAPAGVPSYQGDIKPLLDKRCAVCHGCYDAPCQLKLTSWEGLARGLTKATVYGDLRLVEAPTTRLGVDAQRASQWRGLGFEPVLNERRASPEAELQAAEISRAVLPRLSRSFPVRVFSPDDRPWSWIAGGSPSGPTG